MMSEDHKANCPREQERMRQAGMQLHEGQSRINGKPILLIIVVFFIMRMPIYSLRLFEYEKKQGLAVSRALGDHFIKDNFPGFTGEPFISEPINLMDTDDKIVLASDGVSRETTTDYHFYVTRETD
jgi:hypothetical protein